MSGPTPERRFRVTVYASSSERIDPKWHAVAERLGEQIGARGWDLVWGGSRFGLMGAVSRGARRAGARTFGVILRQFVDKNVACGEAHTMESLDDMRSRKRGLDENGDAFVALPGGLGTLEELLEVMSFKQLGRHAKPIVLANIEGFWAPLMSLIEHMRSEVFIRPGLEIRYHIVDTADAIVPALKAGMAKPVESKPVPGLVEKF